MAKKRGRLAVLGAAVLRQALWLYGSERLPLYLVTEFPKSGGSWVCQLLSAYLDLPYPRNVRPRIEPSVLHGHMLHDRRFRNVTVVHRDGRDIMVSAYYHYLTRNDRNLGIDVDHHRRMAGIADVEDVRSNLPDFIEYMFTGKLHRYHNFTWSDFVDSWAERDAAVVRYEDLLARGEETLSKLLQALGVEDPDPARVAEVVRTYSFKEQTKRAPGKEDSTSFLRKGISGDWKEKFSREACQVFDHFAGQHLIRLGYESGGDWYS